MIGDVLKFLKDRLNTVLPRDVPESAAEDLFVYVASNHDDAGNLQSDAVSMLLVRIEEETTMRQPDPYLRISADGMHQRVSPEIRMNVWVLFVARFPDDYARALRHLSDLIHYFQGHRLFNHENSEDLAAGISQLILELVTPSFGEQNEIWGSLRSAYQPSALYKVKMIVFRDEEGRPLTDVK